MVVCGFFFGLFRRLVVQAWRHKYERKQQEVEVLKREGGDTALAAQWRQRYEKLSLEKVQYLVESCAGLHLHRSLQGSPPLPQSRNPPPLPPNTPPQFIIYRIFLRSSYIIERGP